MKSNWSLEENILINSILEEAKVDLRFAVLEAFGSINSFESRFPYTYHHDFYRLTNINASRSDIANLLQKWSMDPDNEVTVKQFAWQLISINARYLEILADESDKKFSIPSNIRTGVEIHLNEQKKSFDDFLKNPQLIDKEERSFNI